MLGTDEPSDVLGIRLKRDADDAPFMRFFKIVQREGRRQHGRVFFLDTCEGGNDYMADDIDCANISGWLIEPEDIEEFEPVWMDSWTKLPDRFDLDMVVARWSGDPYDPQIEFDFYNRRIAEEEAARSGSRK